MKREVRKKQNSQIILYVTAGVLVLMAIVTSLILYSKSIDAEGKEGQLSSERIASMVDDREDDSQSASSNIGKSVEEGKKEEKQTNEISNNTINTTENNKALNIPRATNETNTVKSTKQNTSNTQTSTTSKSNVTNQSSETNTNVTKEEKKKELSFQKPLEGQIICEFAKENLVFSETLQEWVTHNGIDIQAEKTSVVQAAEDGKVKTIKNDPRYGLTIVIEHDDGFETIYANLLSSEFVTEGENVKKGQSIGTVGNTAAFESADEAHLHFEILKDSQQVNPSIYFK